MADPAMTVRVVLFNYKTGDPEEAWGRPKSDGGKIAVVNVHVARQPHLLTGADVLADNRHWWLRYRDVYPHSPQITGSVLLMLTDKLQRCVTRNLTVLVLPSDRKNWQRRKLRDCLDEHYAFVTDCAAVA